jgi:formate/nitrite transporter FocA (FNT family)
MDILFAGMDMMPVFYGVIMFLGLWSMWHKLTHGNLFGFVIEASIFWLVFSLHGGTMAGGFSAMICALLFGSFFGRRKS